jgi:hypothetical protein
MKCKALILTLAVVMACAIAPAVLRAGPFEGGQAAYQKGDFEAAARLFREPAGQGNADAQFYLGVMYNFGWGVPQDDHEAARWYRLAAGQGHAEAQYNLGLMYDSGQGVPQDYQEAARWHRLAAGRGNAVAQFSLGLMYAKGEGVPQDYVQAHLWLNLAAAQGEKEAAKWRDDLTQKMTPEQIAEAQRLAREWRPSEPPLFGDNPIVGLPNSAPAEPPPGPRASGSGFVVGAAGDLLTNQHVVDSCARLTTRNGGARHPARLVRSDPRNDLALLRMEAPAPAHARFREGRGIQAGDSVVVLGYPLSGLLASEANVTTGAVSALSGPGDDSRLIQISAPVQPGSSGGPILDRAGNVVGIVVSKLDALKVAAAIGDIPQNVNFGIHAAIARTFLDGSGVQYDTAPADRTLDPAAIAAQAKAYTVLVECW